MQKEDMEESGILLEEKETEEIVPLFAETSKIKRCCKELYTEVWEKKLDYGKIDTKSR